MSETQVQAGIVTKLEDEGSECGSRRQAMVLQVTDSIPMGPVSPARAGLSGRSAQLFKSAPAFAQLVIFNLGGVGRPWTRRASRPRWWLEG